MPRLLITGATGQDGSYMCEMAGREGWECFGLSLTKRPSTEFPHAGINMAYGSIIDESFVESVIDEVRPDAICHLAASTSVGESWQRPAETFQLNTVATMRILRQVKRFVPEASVLLAGSAEMYDAAAPLPWNEFTPTRPNNPYGASKAAVFESAKLARDCGLKVSTAILFNHESERRPTSFVTRKIAVAASEIAEGSRAEMFLGNLDIRRDWGYAPEYALAMLQMLSRDEPEDLVLATGTSISVREFAIAAMEELGVSNAAERVLSDPELFRPADTPEERGDPSLAALRLGWRAQLRGKDVAARLARLEFDSRRRHGSS